MDPSEDDGLRVQKDADGALRDRALRFVRENAVELALVALGVFLRIRIGARFDYAWGYDW